MVRYIEINGKKYIVGYNLNKYTPFEYNNLKSSEELNDMLNECKKRSLINEDDYKRAKPFVDYENKKEELIEIVSNYFSFNRKDNEEIIFKICKNLVLEIQENLERFLEE